VSQYGAVVAVDSIYYDGVLREIHDQLRRNPDAFGYVVFNDYDKAYICKGEEGEAFDAESRYSICKGQNGLLQVTSTVRGNIAPYTHKILQTGGLDNWQYVIHTPDGIRKPKREALLFETLHEFQNGDIPYKLCRVMLFDLDSTPGCSQSGLQGIQIMPSLWSTNDTFIDEMEIPNEPTSEVMPERGKQSMNPVGMLTRYTCAEAPADVAKLDIAEFKNRFPIKQGETELDFVNRQKRIRSYFMAWDTFLQGFSLLSNKRSNERLHTSIEDKTHYVTLDIYDDRWKAIIKQIVGVKSCNTYKAKLQHVMAAYVRLGNKTMATSIEYAQQALQKELFNDFGEEIVDFGEAFIIARIMRAQQAVRLRNALGQSESARNAQK
jgi:hypothetical protein